MQPSADFIRETEKAQMQAEDRELQEAIDQYNALSAELKRRSAAANAPKKNASERRKKKQQAQKAARKRNR